MQLSSQRCYRINWNLIGACPVQCPYCAMPLSSIGHILNRQYLFSIARHSLLFPADSYEINFCGGEPFLHPFFGDILEYLFSIPRNIQISIHTCGNVPLALANPVINLCANNNIYKNKKVKFVFHVHPAPDNIKTIGPLLNAVVSIHASLEICLWRDASSLQNMQSSRLKIERLRKVFSFESAEADIDSVPFPRGATSNPTPAQDRNACGIIFMEENQSDISDISPADNHPISESSSSLNNFYFPGLNGININPDGTYTDLTGIFTKERPLWKKSIDPARFILPVRVDRIPAKKLEKIESFAFENEEKAADWLRKELSSRAGDAWRFLPLSDSDDMLPDAKDKLWTKIFASAFFNMEENCATASNPGEVWKRAVDIEKMLEGFCNAQEKEIFISLMRFYAFGGRIRPDGGLPSVTEKGLADTAAYSGMLKLWPFRGARANLKDVRMMMRKFLRKPRAMRIDLPSSVDEFLDLLIWLRECVGRLNYEIRLIPDDSLAYILCSSANAKVKAKKETVRRKLSVIVAAIKNTRDLYLTIDSILLQDIADLEILVACHTPDEKMSASLSDYAARFPGVISCHYSSSEDISAILNESLQMVNGEYVAFAQAGEIWSRGSLAGMILAACMHDCPVAVLLPSRDNGRMHEEIVADEKQALEIFISFASIGQYAQGILFRLENLLNMPVVFEPLPDYEGLVMSLRAIYLAQSVLFLYGDALFKDQTQARAAGRHSGSRHILIRILKELEIFRQTYGLERDVPAWRTFERILYLREKDALLEEIIHSSNKSRFINDDELALLGASWTLMQEIIKDYLLFDNPFHEYPPYPFDHAHALLVSGEKLLDIPQAASFADADMKTAISPLLSVIVAACEYGENLEANFAQMIRAYAGKLEIIVIADGDASEDSFDIYRFWAVKNPFARLYRMAKNYGKEACRQFGINKAQGKYIIFIDNGEIYAPGFIEQGIGLMEVASADIAVFSTDSSSTDSIQESGEDGRLSSRNALIKLWSGELDPFPEGKIFRREIIERTLQDANHFFYDWVDFFISCLLHSHVIYASSVMACQKCASVNGDITDESAVSALCQSWELYDLLYAMYPDLFDAEDANQQRTFGHELICCHFEKNISGVCKSFIQRLGYVPMTRKDFASLGKNVLFMRAILEGAATANETRAAFVRNLPVHVLLQKTESMPPFISIIMPSLKNSGIPKTIAGDMPAMLSKMGVMEYLELIPHQTLEELTLSCKGDYIALAPVINKDFAHGLMDCAAFLCRHGDIDLLVIDIHGQDTQSDNPNPLILTNPSSLERLISSQKAEDFILMFSASFLKEHGRELMASISPWPLFCAAAAITAKKTAFYSLFLPQIQKMAPFAQTCEPDDLTQIVANTRAIFVELRNQGIYSGDAINKCMEWMAKDCVNITRRFLPTFRDTSRQAMLAKTLWAFPPLLESFIRVCARNYPGAPLPDILKPLKSELRAVAPHAPGSANSRLAAIIFVPQANNTLIANLDCLARNLNLEVILLIPESSCPVLPADFAHIRAFQISAGADVSQAFNLALQYVESPYVFFADSPDSIVNDHMFLALDALNTDECPGVVFFNIEEYPPDSLHYLLENAHKLLLAGKGGPAFYSLEFLRNNAIRFQPGDSEGILFFLKAILACGNFLYCCRRIFSFCRHEEKREKDYFEFALARLAGVEKIRRMVEDTHEKLSKEAFLLLEEVVSACFPTIMGALKWRVTNNVPLGLSHEELAVLSQSYQFLNLAVSSWQ